MHASVTIARHEVCESDQREDIGQHGECDEPLEDRSPYRELELRRDRGEDRTDEWGEEDGDGPAPRAATEGSAAGMTSTARAPATWTIIAGARRGACSRNTLCPVAARRSNGPMTRSPLGWPRASPTGAPAVDVPGSLRLRRRRMHLRHGATGTPPEGTDAAGSWRPMRRWTRASREKRWFGGTCAPRRAARPTRPPPPRSTLLREAPSEATSVRNGVTRRVPRDGSSAFGTAIGSLLQFRACQFHLGW